jgi:hypothetical protein
MDTILPSYNREFKGFKGILTAKKLAAPSFSQLWQPVSHEAQGF